MRSLAQRRARLRAASLVFLLFPFLSVWQNPAFAAGGSELQFEGTASLPHFPCPVGASGCTAEFDGLLTGQMGGRAPRSGGGETTWSAALADAAIHASFAYEDTSCVFGTAVGSGTLSAEVPHMLGTYDDGGPFPRKVQGMLAQASLSWQRSGATAVLFFDDATLSLDVVGLGWVDVAFDGSGTGAAVFVPEVDPDTPPPPCTQTPPPSDAPSIRATVIGAVTLAE